MERINAKRTFKIFALAVLVASVALMACAMPAFAKVRINKSSLTMTVGQEKDVVFQTYNTYSGWDTYYDFEDEIAVSWSSSNYNVVDVDHDGMSICTLTALKPGKATVTGVNSEGERATCTVTVKAETPSFSIYKTIEYGSKKVTFDVGEEFAGCKAKMKIAGKTRKAKVNSKGKVTFKKLPLAKCGSKAKVSITKFGKTGSCKVKVKGGSRYGVAGILYVKPLFKGKKVVKVYFNDFVHGDVLKVKIGSKTYKKKIKFDGEKTVKVKIKRSVAGKKVTVTLYDHFGKKVQRDKSKVWRGKYIYQGDTKKQVKMTYGFGTPDHINYYTDHEQWCYDGAYLYFYGNSLRSWQIFG